MTTPSPDSSHSGTDTRNAVAAVLEDQARREARRTATARRVRTRRLGYPAVVVLAGLSLWLWIAPPDAFLPDPPPPPSPGAVETGLRMDMWAAAMSLERASSGSGSLPLTLEEALEEPDDAPDVRYLRIGPTEYVLVGERMGVSLRWSSTEGIEALATAPEPEPLPGGVP